MLMSDANKGLSGRKRKLGAMRGIISPSCNLPHRLKQVLAHILSTPLKASSNTIPTFGMVAEDYPL